MTSGPGNLTTSGDTEYSQVATEIITSALQIAGVINEDETPTAGMFKTCFRALNSMVKEWETSGLHIWTVREAVLFLQPNQERYLLGGTTTDHCADAYSYQQSTLNLSAAAGDTSVNLVSAAGIAKGDNVGIVLDTGSAFWTTAADDPTGNVLTLSAAMPSSASAGNFDWSYTANIVRPLRVVSSRRLAWQGLLETPMGLSPGQMLSRAEYMNLPNKNATGIPTSAYYNPARVQGEFFVWPAPVNASSAIRFTWYRPIESFVTVDDLPDLPQEWINTLDWNLSKEVGPVYDVEAERYDRIVARAAEKLEMAQGWDREPQSVFFGRSYSPGGR
jgi:hypothetical protein